MNTVYYVNCVKCGCEIEIDFEHFEKYQQMPPYCEDCAKDVQNEVAKNYGMWPHGWHGQAMLMNRRGRRWWQVTIKAHGDGFEGELRD
jgi:NAD-dependent SIR2 family protein deacetylase